MDIESLRSLLKTMEKPSGSCSFAQNGKIPIFYVLIASNQDHSSTWVIDSGALDHMTYSTGAFRSHQTCLNSKKITVVDGSVVTGINCVLIKKLIIDSSVLVEH